MSITPETLAWLRQTAKFEGAVTAQVLLHLLERVEALEQRPTCKQAAPVATDEELWSLWANRPNFPNSAAAALRAVYGLGRQHGAAQPAAAQPTPPPAPARGLVERVVAAIADPDGPTELWVNDARAAIRAVAAWMRENETGFNAVRLLEQEADHA